jgi:predicted DNA-binding transcriptional regulator AlpA
MAQPKIRRLAIPESAEFLTTLELAALLQISRWTLGNWRKTGKGPPFLKISRGTVRYPWRALVDWLNQHIKGILSGGGTAAQHGGMLHD